jgi:hypothetical protein
MHQLHAARLTGLVIFGAAALGAIVFTGFAPCEASSFSVRAPAARVFRADKLFTNLKPCEIPGVRERVLDRGKMIAFAGEFTPTTAIPWASGPSRIVLYIVSGTGEVRIGAMTSRAGRGDVFVIPAGVRHAVRAQKGPLRAIYVETRG